ncbi:hypothetical protein Dda_0721 [Drechslerella dactyloides]|uniref:Mitochondrial import inner membrane translocase subunit TIM50 n=1 Tax=Drechslerella dactyloides TaxID=74499 RepID=A0AAD6J6S2_DREDA|nr:hypothetical protein Dda_0721 [Drechslerella dactyloides]
MMIAGRAVLRSSRAQLQFFRGLQPSTPRYPTRLHSTASLLRTTIARPNPWALSLPHISHRNYATAQSSKDQDPTSQPASREQWSDEVPKSTESPEPSQESRSDASAASPEESEPVPRFDPRTLLDQGIPPTPDQYNTAVATKPDPTGSERSRDPIKAAQSRGSGGGNSEYVSSTDRKRDRLAAYLFLTSLLSVVGATVYLGRNWESQAELAAHPEAPNGWGLLLFYKRITTRLNEVLDYYNLPIGDKLLPDPTKETYRPYTLVISLEDMIIHSEWTREHGWRTAKRPGVEYFLTYLSQYYEIVIFTSQPNVMAGPILAKLDPYHMYYQLFREATKYKGGKYIKDLSYLNRDLSKVIMIDTKPDAWADQPENAIKMKPWKGDPRDKELIALIPFLEFIAAMGHVDLREDLKSFPEGSHIPTEFAKRDAIARAELKKKLEDEKKAKRQAGGGSFLAGMLGMQPRVLREEKLPQDMVREKGQQWYDEVTKNLKEHGEEFLEADRKAQEEILAGMKTSLSKILTEGMPQPPLPPPEQQQQQPTEKK